MIPWREMVAEAGNRTVGTSRVLMDRSTCLRGECNLGNFVADAFLHYYVMEEAREENEWSHVGIAITNVGGVRTTMHKGG